MRIWLVALVTFLLGSAAGYLLPRWPTPAPSGFESRWEATLYLPAPGGDFTEDTWKAALTEFTREPFRGATLLAPVEGWWHGDDGKVAREAVRPIVVSFASDHLPEFQARARALGKRLGQEAIYIRYERPFVQLLFP